MHDFDQELAAKGHFAAGFALQDSATATTVRWTGGRAARVDGPFEVRPADEAFMAQHPILKKQQEKAT